MNYNLSEIFIYPVKSLGGTSLKEAEVTERGLKFDRRWMLVDSTGKFITQRIYPQMSLIAVDISNDKLIFRHKKTSEQIEVGFNETTGNKLNTVIWNDTVETLHVSTFADEWFEIILGIKCRLVYMPDQSKRFVDKTFAHNDELTNLTDGYPFLIIGQESLNDLNSRLKEKLPVNRFRPNFVFSGGASFDEDKMKSFTLGSITFYPVKPCARCVITTTDQNSGERNEEPLATLSTYRKVNNKVMFGQNLLHKGSGIIQIGDELQNIEWK